MARFTARVAMRWQDMDAYGHVNNVQFLTYVEEARVELFQSVPLSGLDPSKSGILVAASDIRYLRPLFHRAARVPIDVWVTKIRAASFSLGYEVYDTDGTIYATAGSTMVPYDFTSARPRRLTPEERAWLTQYLEEEPDPVREPARS